MRGLNKPSTNTIEQQKTTDPESTAVPNQEPTTDENGMTFLVNSFEMFEKGSNPMFGDDVPKFSLQSEKKKFFVEIRLSLLLSQTLSISISHSNFSCFFRMARNGR